MKNILLLSSLLLFVSNCTLSSKPADDANIDRSGIKKSVYRHRKEIRECYGKTLAKKGSENLFGTVVLNFDINNEGKAQKTFIMKDKSTLNNPDLNTCLISNFEQWDFPVPKDGQVVNVQYPLSFKDTPARNMQQKMDQFKKIKDKPSQAPSKTP